METALSHVTSLIGDPVRTNVLWTLLDGRAYTASELAVCANTSLPNMSMHLNKLVQADLLAVESQGRHKYYRFSRPEVAYAIEAIGNLITQEKHQKIITNKDNTAMKYCRTCYDHLAGRVGVLITEALLKQRMIEAGGNNFTVTKKGAQFFSALDINISALKSERRSFAKPCLDWSERKHHLAGSLGAAMLTRFVSLDYVRRTKNSRAVIVTSKGETKLYEMLKLSM